MPRFKAEILGARLARVHALVDRLADECRDASSREIVTTLRRETEAAQSDLTQLASLLPERGDRTEPRGRE